MRACTWKRGPRWIVVIASSVDASLSRHSEPRRTRLSAENHGGRKVIIYYFKAEGDTSWPLQTSTSSPFGLQLQFLRTNQAKSRTW